MLNQLQLYNFRNHKNLNLSFLGRIHCICGENGIGKTNILDAIYYLAFTKSYFTSSDNLVIHYDEEEMFVEGFFNKEKVKCLIRNTKKKEVYANDVRYTKFSEHIGKFPTVMISPDDIELINGASDARRKFLDLIIAQLDKKYMQALNQYNKILQQRNAIFKKYNYLQHDKNLLKTYNEQFAENGAYIFEKRQNIFVALNAAMLPFYKKISGEKDIAEAKYISIFQQASLLDVLNENTEKEFMAGRTLYGIHKDEVEFKINNMLCKNGASQGQKKTYLFALKFAEHEILKNKLKIHPTLLLDDVFEKLDAQRMQNLIGIMKNTSAQIFITDTQMERLQDAFENIETQMIVLK